MRTTQRVVLVVSVLAGLAVAGCKGQGKLTFTNQSSEALEVAVLGPGLIEPFPPRVPLAAAPGASSGGAAEPPSVSFTVTLAPQEMPTSLSWKASGAQGFIPVTAPEDIGKDILITRGKLDAGKSVTPKEQIFDTQVESSLALFSRARDALASPSPQTWTAVAEDWDKALQHAREAEASLKALASDPNTAGHREGLLRNLTLTIADGYVRVGQAHESAQRGADGNLLKAACNYVKADALGCFRVKAIRAALRERVRAEFRSTFLARLGQDKVEKQGGQPMTSATHRFSALTLERDGMRYTVEETTVKLLAGGKMGEEKTHRGGTVAYGQDLLPGSSVQLGDLQLESEPTKAWPRQLRRLWRALGVLEDAREPQKELDWIKDGGEDKL